MKKPKILQVIVAGFLLLCTLWAATPKAFIHNLFDHSHTNSIILTGETSIQNSADQDCDFEKYNTPVYFTIFKFINHFIPVKPREEAYFSSPHQNYRSFDGLIDSQRAPPLA